MKPAFARPRNVIFTTKAIRNSLLKPPILRTNNVIDNFTANIATKSNSWEKKRFRKPLIKVGDGMQDIWRSRPSTAAAIAMPKYARSSTCSVSIRAVVSTRVLKIYHGEKHGIVICHQTFSYMEPGEESKDHGNESESCKYGFHGDGFCHSTLAARFY